MYCLTYYAKKTFVLYHLSLDAAEGQPKKMAKRNTIAEYYNTYLSIYGKVLNEGSENILKLLI